MNEEEEFFQYLFEALKALADACRLSLKKDEGLKVSLAIGIEDSEIHIPIPPHAVFSVAAATAQEIFKDFRSNSDFREKIPPHILQRIDAAFVKEKVFN